MRTKKYSCPNGCKLPPRKKELTEIGQHKFGFAYIDFPYCPMCGSMMPYTRKKYKDFFENYHLHPKLKTVERLFLKSEFDSAAREAFIVVESVLRKKSGLDSHGFDLATKALKYEVDKQTGVITKQPLIALNDLKTESEKNEQEGVRYMLMGFFQGIRNIYQHNRVESAVSNVLTIILDASLFLNLLDGNSFTKHARWIREKVDYKDIYENMPNRLDRIKLLYMLKKQQCHRLNEKSENEGK